MQKKSGFAAIVGKPNAGKSTLLNAILGQNLSVVTPKPQTTRNKVFGIYSTDDVQVVFADTPGILKPKYKLQEFMNREIDSSFIGADVILLVIDISKYDTDELTSVYTQYEKEFTRHKVFCVLNKIDMITGNEVLLVINDISQKFKFDEIIPVSSLKKFNIDELLKTISKYMPENDFYFDTESVSSQPEKFFASEIIRASALRLYREEIPFSLFIEIEEFKERARGKDFIRANIITEKDSQKKIIIGKDGLMLKTLGERARKEIEKFFGNEVYLELFVKVKKGWRNDEQFLKKRFSPAGVSSS